MFIETEATPNPETLKFIPGRTVLETGSANFTDRDSAARSPLAMALFGINGVEGVFLGFNFITVTKSLSHDWDALKAVILNELMQFFTSGAPVITDTEEQEPSLDISALGSDEDAEIIHQIQDLLNEKVRPAIAQDGGNIEFHGFKEGVVYLELQGACAGCPSSTMTLKHGIENLLKYYVPEIIDVRAIEQS